jgi:predicted Zn-dependent peptidase
MGFNTFQRMKATKSSPSGGGAFIGFDEKDIKKEFERAFKELENLHDGVTTAQIRRIARKALKPMVKAYRSEIKSLPTTSTTKNGKKRTRNVFTVYRKGGVYAEITKGQLAKSIGIITTRVNRGQTFASLQVGPRVKRSFSDPEKGGWFAHFLEYGYLADGKYKGANKGFARRARTKNSAGVGNEFKRLMRSFLNKKTKEARQ